MLSSRTLRTALTASALATLVAFVPTLSSAQERVFDVVGPFEIGGLDPSISGFVFQRMQITETLLEADAQGKPIPGLAERWTESADGLTWRLALHASRSMRRTTMRSWRSPGITRSASS